MRTLMTMAAWFALSGVLLTLVLWPGLGAVMLNPPVAASLGLIGLGMLRHARQNQGAPSRVARA